VLFNLCRALEEDSSGTVVLVEGFFDCIKTPRPSTPVWRSWDVPYRKSRRTAGATFSPSRLDVGWRRSRRRAAGDSAGRLAHTVWVRVVEVPQGNQPDQLSVGEIADLLQGL